MGKQNFHQYLDLHSSMVIVKQSLFLVLEIIDFTFTFQYGYSKTFLVPLLLLSLLHLHSSMVIVKRRHGT